MTFCISDNFVTSHHSYCISLKSAQFIITSLYLTCYQSTQWHPSSCFNSIMTFLTNQQFIVVLKIYYNIFNISQLLKFFSEYFKISKFLGCQAFSYVAGTWIFFLFFFCKMLQLSPPLPFFPLFKCPLLL